MTLIANTPIEDINIDNIELEYNDFKISKPVINEKLRASININGLLEPPVLLKKNNSYIIIYGHNRLKVLKQMGCLNVPSVVIDGIDPKAYADYAILKNYRGEIGPFGKIKFIRILKSLLCTDEYLSAISNIMQIPKEVILGKWPWENVQRLPDELRDYIDTKDIGFKIIRNLMSLPDEGMSLLTAWVSDSFRVNIFKGIVDLICDINKRDKTLLKLMQIDASLINDRRQKEEFLFNEIFKIRYPAYTEIKVKAEQFINKLRHDGMEINFPEYFESDEIGLILKINKRDGIKTFQDKIDHIDIEALRSLLDLL